MDRSWRRRFTLLVVVSLLLGVVVSLLRRVAPAVAHATTPASPRVAITTETVATISLPAAAIPPPPAIVDVWVWRLSPGEEHAFATGDSPPSIAVDVVLEGAYAVRSEGRLQVQRATGLQEVPPGTVVTVRAGEAVIYFENQTAQTLRNTGTEPARTLSCGVFSAAPPAGVPVGPLGQED
jgi:hypothetical protein